MTAFEYGERVRVKLPRKRAFVGTVYSEYRLRPGGERLICVNTPSGAGVAYRIRYVSAVTP